MVHFRKPQVENDNDRKSRIEEIEKFFHKIKVTIQNHPYSKMKLG